MRRLAVQYFAIVVFGSVAVYEIMAWLGGLEKMDWPLLAGVVFTNCIFSLFIEMGRRP
jgi:hypothetical protein